MHSLTIRWADLGGDMGWWDAGTRTIWLDHSLTHREEVSTLLHEFLHARRGDVACGGQVERVRESIIDRITAEALIDIRALAVALRWSHNVHEVADELGVDEATVRVRLTSLQDADRFWLADLVNKGEMA